MAASFADRKTKKEYLCVVVGQVRDATGSIENFIGRNPKHRQKMAIVPGEKQGRYAHTDWIRLGVDQEQGFSLIHCKIHTGRTHQIRVHMAYSVGHAILGDPIYGKGTLKRKDASRLMLHAWKLGFSHPITFEEMAFESPLPKEFKRAMGSIE